LFFFSFFSFSFFFLWCLKETMLKENDERYRLPHTQAETTMSSSEPKLDMQEVENDTKSRLTALNTERKSN